MIKKLSLLVRVVIMAAVFTSAMGNCAIAAGSYNTDFVNELVKDGYIPAYVLEKGQFTQEQDADFVEITGNNVRMRSQPNAEARIIATFSVGDLFVYWGEWTNPKGELWVLGHEAVGNHDDAPVGWISGKYIHIERSRSAHSNNDTTRTAYVNTESGINLRVHEKPSFESAIITTYERGHIISIQDEESDTEGNLWYRINISGETGRTVGYVAAQYITFTEIIRDINEWAQEVVCDPQGFLNNWKGKEITLEGELVDTSFNEATGSDGNTYDVAQISIGSIGVGTFTIPAKAVFWVYHTWATDPIINQIVIGESAIATGIVQTILEREDYLEVVLYSRNFPENLKMGRF